MVVVGGSVVVVVTASVVVVGGSVVVVVLVGGLVVVGGEAVVLVGEGSVVVVVTASVVVVGGSVVVVATSAVVNGKGLAAPATEEAVAMLVAGSSSPLQAAATSDSAANTAVIKICPFMPFPWGKVQLNSRLALEFP